MTPPISHRVASTLEHAPFCDPDALVQTEPSFTFATPEILFEGAYVSTTRQSFVVAPDGQRFLMIKRGGGAEGTSAQPQVIVVQNWHEELKRPVPTT